MSCSPTVLIDIPGPVVSKHMARSMGRGRIHRLDEAKRYVEMVQHLAKLARRAVSTPRRCPLDVVIRICLVPPQSWSAARRQRAVEGAIVPTVKPDVPDNAAGLILDGLKKVLFEEDDCYIYRATVEKVYAPEMKALCYVTWRTDREPAQGWPRP